MRKLSPIGYIGRGIAAAGAVALIASLFVAFQEGYSATYWDVLRRMDVITLILGLLTLVLLGASMFVPEEPTLFAVGVIGGVDFGYFAPDFIEGTWNKATGAYLASLGSTGVVLGAAVAFLPVLAERVGGWRGPAFIPQQAPAAAAPAPGWYADPSGQARLRFWDGQAWSEQTQN